VARPIGPGATGFKRVDGTVKRVNSSSQGYGLVGQSVNSFASNLHRLLKKHYGITSLSFARVHLSGTRMWGDLLGSKGVKKNGGDKT
jgi:hypothetical protein